MTDPDTIGDIVKNALNVIDKLLDWYIKAWDRANTREQQDAVELIYSAAVLAASIAALDAEFQTLRDSIEKLDNTTPDRQEREALAGKVHDLARSERHLRAIKEKTAFIRVHIKEPGWRDRIFGWNNPELGEQKQMELLVAAGNEVLEEIGANLDVPTPLSIGYLERQLSGHTELWLVKRTAKEVLDKIGYLTTRSIADVFGKFAGSMSKKHGIPVPDWASGVVRDR